MEPLHPNNPEWIGSSYNLSIEWENGETIVDTFRATSSAGPNACNNMPSI
jgi:hypothetical protein